MKKIISLLLLLTLLVSIFVGCDNSNNDDKGNGGGTLPRGMSGTDAAKLLLANERLDGTLLQADGSIFVDGVEVMNNLAQKTRESMAALRGKGGVSTFSTAKSSKTTISGPETRGKLEKDDEYFYWSEFDEYNNTYEYFENLTQNIITSAQIAADLIDHVKKHVRVVDKWVNNNDVIKYYLHVEENSELLIEHYTGEGLDLLNICTRFRNEDGKDVYQLYRKSVTEMYEERMTYIPGERYELSMMHRDNTMDCFVADHSKGYWESCILGIREGRHANISYFVMKDDLCYEAMVDAEADQIQMLKVMSADTATDIFHISPDTEARITLKLSGFNGIKNVQAPVADVIYNQEAGYANLASWETGVVNLENGKTINYGDTFVDGNVRYQGVTVGSFAGDVYAGDMLIVVQGNGQEEQFEVFKQFLQEMGLTCRRDIDLVLAGVNAAYADAISIANYYQWNGVTIVNQEKVFQGQAVELERFAEMLAHYTNVKDAPVVDINDTTAMELSINFAPITASSFSGAAVDGLTVSVQSASLTIEDTTLYVKDEPYKVMFALESSNGGLVHVDVETATTAYNNEKPFTVTASNVQFTLPQLAEGSYTLVAYIATSDGIRSSKYTALTDVNVSGLPLNLQNVELYATKDESGAMVITYQQITDFTIELTTDKMGYQQFAEAVFQLIFQFGTPTEVIEVESADTYTPLTGNETEIASGTYRVGYKIENGSHTVEGYVYIQYTAK